MPTLGIYGAGGLGREILEIAKAINTHSNRWECITFIDDGDVPEEVNNIPVVKYQAIAKDGADEIEIAVGIGEPAVRESIYKKLERDGMKLATLIHPSTYIPETAHIGEGATVSMGCFISCNVSIGCNVYIQPHVNIGHDCAIGDGCIISSSCNIGGSVHIGDNTYLGLGVTVKEKAQIGSWTIVGMSSSVIRDIPDEVVALGNPARAMKNNDERRVFN